MAATVKVWDRFVRIFHWTLVSSFVVGWLSADEWNDLHEWAGYAAAALIAMRVLWGFIGTRYAKFAEFVRPPASVAAYVRDCAAGEERRYVGHNPAGGVMVVLLIATMGVVCLSGWLYTTEAFWGVEWVEETHEASANALLALVSLHVMGVVWTSIRLKENLVRAMFTGRKRPAEEPDVV